MDWDKIFVVVQSLSYIWLFATPWTAACQASLSLLSPGVAQTHVHWVGDAIQPSHPLSLPLFLPVFPSISVYVCRGVRLIMSGSFPMTWLFASGGQNIGSLASASVLPMNIQGWFPLGLTGLISCSLRNSQESSPAPQFKSIDFLEFSPLYSSNHICTWLLGRLYLWLNGLLSAK